MTGRFGIESLAEQARTGGPVADTARGGGDPAAELAALHIQVWREAYTGLIDQDYLDGMEPAPRTERWREWIDLAHRQRSEQVDPGAPVNRVRLAREVNGGRIAGVCRVGAARDDHAPLPQELSSLNVLADFHGTGVARLLVDATLGGRPAYLWVVRQNLRAQAFYRKLGFAPDGGAKRDDNLGCDEIRMVRH